METNIQKSSTKCERKYLKSLLFRFFEGKLVEQRGVITWSQGLTDWSIQSFRFFSEKHLGGFLELFDLFSNAFSDNFAVKSYSKILSHAKPL